VHRLLDGGPEDTVVFWADLIPTAAHVPYPWIMGYDLYPMTTLENKKHWLPRAAEEGWLAIFEHDDVPLPVTGPRSGEPSSPADRPPGPAAGPSRSTFDMEICMAKKNST
jgi:glyoxylase-like metal-dependent hydrolase (beta-lactamase superfamily II)